MSLCGLFHCIHALCIDVFKARENIPVAILYCGDSFRKCVMFFKELNNPPTLRSRVHGRVGL